ncbi:MAG: amino acid aminotransferase [Patescibacteria group bacterium]
MNLIGFFNGKYLPVKKIKISIFDLGLLRSYAVFDFIRTYNQKPFLLDDHLKRFFNSARALSLKSPYNFEEIKRIINKLIETNKNKAKEFNLRIVLTGGESENSTEPGKPNFLIIVTPLKNLNQSIYKKGIKLITKIYERPFPQVKSTLYGPLIKFLIEAKKKKAFEVLLLDRNKMVLECTTSNFFIVKKNKVYTPPLKNVLGGITQKFIFKLMKENKIPFEEKEIKYEELKIIDECFITATNKEIIPVVKIDNFKIGSGKPGKITLNLINLFKQFVENY